MWYLCVLFLSYAHTVQSESFPWLLKISTSDSQASTFKGSLFLSLVKAHDETSEEQMFDAVLAPNYNIVRPLTLSQKMLTGTTIKIFFASYSCESWKPSPVIIKTLELISGSSGMTYKAVNIVAKTEHAIGQCVNASVFRDFTQISNIIVQHSSLCYIDGRFYEAGASVSLGCRQNCTCTDGQLSCKSLCIDSSKSGSGVTCRNANVLGACCPDSECQHDGDKFLKIVKCQSPKFYEDLDFVVPPWVYFIVTDRYSEKKGSWCGATLISEKLLLTPAHCVYTIQSSTKLDILAPPEFIEVYQPSETGKVHLIGEVPSQRISAIKVHPGYKHSSTEKPFSQLDFAVLELSVPIRLSTSSQFINLPWAKQCFQYFDNVQCQVISTAYANDTTTLLFDNVFGTNTMGSLADDCQNGKNFFCFDKAARPNQLILGGIDGSGVVAKRNGHYELIGIAMSGERSWRKPGTEGSSAMNVLSICDSLKWIMETIELSNV